MSKIFLILISCLNVVSCGNQQPQLSPLMPDDVIVAFGDSLTYGAGVFSTTSYPYNLALITGHKVINAGIPSDESAQEAARISQVLAQTHPRLVIVCLGGNDFLHRRSYQHIKRHLVKIIQAIKHSGAQVVLIAEPEPSFTFRVPALYLELAKEFCIPVNVVMLPKLFRVSVYKSDTIHFNQKGYRVFAEEVANFLAKQGAIKKLFTASSLKPNL